MTDLEKTVRINMLLDFYSTLLTSKQLEYMKFYYRADLSLSEIAEKFNVSRNAVYDNIKRSIKQLENYEDKLMLFNRFNQRLEIYEKIKKECNDKKIIDYIEKLENIE